MTCAARGNSRKTPLPWQRDPSRLKTNTVQYWRNGIMVSAMVPLAMARAAVEAGTAFVISSQAVGALDDRGEYMV